MAVFGNITFGVKNDDVTDLKAEKNELIIESISIREFFVLIVAKKTLGIKNQNGLAIRNLPIRYLEISTIDTFGTSPRAAHKITTKHKV